MLAVRNGCEATLREVGGLAHITVAERVSRIRKLLNELNKMPPRSTRSCDYVLGDPINCSVISIDAHELLLNHRSHRVRSQLQDDPQWEELKHDPQGEAAQEIIAGHIREGQEYFEPLQQSLRRDGQKNPGIVTHDGVIINGNTRAVVIRESADPASIHSCCGPSRVDPAPGIRPS